MLFVGIQAWRSDFHSRSECSVSDKGVQKIALDVPGDLLGEVETDLVQKKWSESRIAGVVR